MEIIHCLLWARNGEITVIGHNDGKNELLKIAGKKSIPSDCINWNEMKEYMGIYDGVKSDICLIFDEDPHIDESMFPPKCEKSECIWSDSKIEDAVRMLEITYPLEIADTNGRIIKRSKNGRTEKTAMMTAVYEKAEREPVKSVTDKDLTPFIKFWLDQLSKYRDGAGI